MPTTPDDDETERPPAPHDLRGAPRGAAPMSPEQIAAAVREERQQMRTFVPSDEEGIDADAFDVDRWLNERMARPGEQWWGYPDTASGVPGASVFARFRKNDAGRWVLSGVLVLGDAVSPEQIRKVPFSALENSFNLSTGDADQRMRAELAKLAPLRREPDMAPEDFSRRVAEHFKVWSRYVPHAAAAMARQWDVKLPTMHGWIREARLRGFLPAAQRGRSVRAATEIVKTDDGIDVLAINKPTPDMLRQLRDAGPDGPETLRQVARIYRLADGDAAAVEAVERAFQIDSRTAIEWIERARRAGHFSTTIIDPAGRPNRSGPEGS